MSTATEAPKFELQPYKSLENDVLEARIQAVRDQLGSQLMILGHHYQQDEVIAQSDLRGDSYLLSQMAADSTDCRHIAFCGVHFMAETADILANRPDKVAERDGERVSVYLPDLAAGCSMADMAAIDQIEDAWDQLGEVIDTEDLTPVTYINSAASLKAFVGRHGGIVCTSSNARAAMEWAFARTSRVMFFPDQHLGRNTALGMDIVDESKCRSGIRSPTTSAATAKQHCSKARSFSGRAIAAYIKCSNPSTSPCSATSTPASKSWSTQNAHAMCLNWPTSTAAPEKSSSLSKPPRPAANGRSAPSCT